VACVVIGCSVGGHVPMQVQAQQTPGVDIQAFQTFAWLQAPLATNGVDDGPAVFDWKVRNAVDGGLLQKGYAKGTNGTADFLVAYDVSLKNKHTEAFSEWFEYRARGGNQGLGNAFMDGYTEGTLVLQVIDGKNRGLVWRGAASAVIDPGTGDGRRIDEAVRLLLARFPSHG
jgi:hypothetical protein